MAKDKYEISLWEDIYVEANETTGAPAHYEEQKLCVIGSNTMTAECRAIEPKFTRNVNGKNTFTFKMFYIYRDDKTGQMYDNPFLKLLVNERKVKVLWLNEWYDLVIKNIQEASNGKSMIFTCEDANINELAKSGFELTFDDELNTTEFTNQGTAAELINTTIDGTDWKLGNVEVVPQYSEEPVFEINLTASINVELQDPQLSSGMAAATTTIPSGQKILVFYNQLADRYNSAMGDGAAESTAIPFSKLQIAYASSYTTEVNSQLVINSNCYKVTDSCSTRINTAGGRSLKLTIGSGTYTLASGAISKNYRAKRLVESTKMVIDQYTGNTCEVYAASGSGTGYNDGDIIYKHVGTVFDKVSTVVNMAANPSNFLSLAGWDISGWYANSTANLEYLYYIGTTTQSVTNSYVTINFSEVHNRQLIYNEAMKASAQYFSDGVKVGDKFIVRFKIRKPSSYNNPSSYISSTSDYQSTLKPFVQSYTVDSNSHKRPSDTTANTYYMNTVDNTPIFNNGWCEWTLECKKPFTAADIYSKNLGLFLSIQPIESINKYFIEAVEFYKYLIDGEGSRVDPGDFNKEDAARVKYQYYNHEQFEHDYTQGTTTLNDLNNYYIYSETMDYSGSAFVPVLVDNFAKIRSINIKQSNRFNILQTIAETFQCWIKFRVEHDSTGKIIYSKTNGEWRLKKYIDVVNEVGEDRGIGFIYGIDLQNISRTIESNSIVTKTLVLPNDNEFAKDGQCRISRSAFNPSKADYIYNFDYYTSHALLDKNSLFDDLYVNTIVGDAEASTQVGGFYHWMRKWNEEYEELSTKLVNIRVALLEYEALLKTYSELKEAASQTILDTQYEVTFIVGKVGKSWDTVLAEIISEGHQNDKEIKPRLAAITSQEKLITSYEDAISQLTSKVDNYTSQVKILIDQLKEISDWIRAKSLAFYKKYAAFISEGSWTDPKYMDDNLYYLDAQSVAYTSSRPKVSYNISVLRLTALPEYKDKDFFLGDIAFVQDTEFFGYSDAARTTPYKEKVLISEITYNFDEPSKDSFKVQNYKTQFEDLFQRIAAATQSLQFNEGIYARAGEVVSADGKLNLQFLEDTFDENGNVLNRTSLNQSVTTDEAGVTVRSLVDSASIVRITSGGIFISNDGGATWKNAIRGDGVSTRYLTAGQIDTGLIQVIDGSHPTFRWDSNGINAYQHNDTGFDYTTFVRMDQFGFYGVAGASSAWVPNSEAEIRGMHGAFGATWSGFFINNANGDQVFATDTSGNLSITGTITANAGDIGGWAIGSTALYKKRFASYTSTAGVTYDNGYYYIYASAPTTPSATSRAFGVLYRDANDQTVEYLCEMTYGGKLFARNADITGTIHARTLYLGSSDSTLGNLAYKNNVSVSEVSGLGAVATWGSIKYTDVSGLGATATWTYETVNGLPINLKFCVDKNGQVGVDPAAASEGTGFKITTDGLMTARNAIIWGTIYASAGSIGGWTIANNSLKSGSASDSNLTIVQSSGVYAFVAGCSQTNTYDNAKFTVRHDGTLKATAGQIAGWTMSSTSLYKTATNVTIDGATYAECGPQLYAPVSPTGGNIAFGIRRRVNTTDSWSYPFLVHYNGKVECSNLTVTGGSINIGSGVFSVSSAGVVKCSNITATGGTIGGCSITDNKLTIPAANITGKLTAGQIDATSLVISGSNVSGAVPSNSVKAVQITSGYIQLGSSYTRTYISNDGLQIGTTDIWIKWQGPYNTDGGVIIGTWKSSTASGYIKLDNIPSGTNKSNIYFSRV